MQHLGYYWAKCSGLNRKILQELSNNLKDRFLKNTQWVYIEESLKVIFSHAGVSQVWFDSSGIKSIYNINDLPPNELFAFTPNRLTDYCGESETQPLTWIRPNSLCRCNIKGWDQVVGHTPVNTNIINISKACKYKQNIWLCDALDVNQYLCIEDSNYIIKHLNNNESTSN